MRITSLFGRRRRRQPEYRQVADWTVGWTSRDWADLPAYHPPRDDSDRR